MENPVTRHPKLVSHFCTFAQAACRFAPLHFTSRHPHPGPPPATRIGVSPDTRYSILDTLVFHFCTFAPAAGRFALLHYGSGPPSLQASRLQPLSTCQLASMPPRASACPLVTLPTCPLAAFGRAYSEFRCSFEEYPCSPSERLETRSFTFGARPWPGASTDFAPSISSCSSSRSSFTGCSPVRAGATSISASTVINTIFSTGTSEE